MAKRFIQYFEDSVRCHWDIIAMTNYVTKKSYTYGEVGKKIALLHLFFERMNVENDDKIAIIGDSSPEWAIANLAILTYGAISIPILSNFRKEEVENIINHSEAKFVFVSSSQWSDLKISTFNGVSAIISYDTLEFFCSSYSFSIDDIKDEFSDKFPLGYSLDDVKYKNKDDEEVALISYTSGTSGESKGVMLTGANFCCVIDYERSMGLFKSGTSYFSFLPLAHMYGCVHDLFFPFSIGASITFLVNMKSPKMLIAAFSEVKPIYFSSVPLIMETIYKKYFRSIMNKANVKFLMRIPLIKTFTKKYLANKLREVFGGKLKCVFFGGASLEREVEDFLCNIGFPYSMGYGMTECAPLISNDFISLKPYSVGKPYKGVSIKIDSSDPRHSPGEILVKGANVMKGYFKNDKATNAAFTADGWFKTGDLGVIDEEGNLFLKGRIKNLILTSTGENVYPEEIETELKQYNGILECVVVQRKNKIIALVYPDYNAIETNSVNEYFESIRQAANKKLTALQYINSIEIQASPFEKTPKNSIRRTLYK